MEANANWLQSHRPPPVVYIRWPKLATSVLFILDTIAESIGAEFEIITPRDWNERGSQLSVFLHGQGRQLFDKLMDAGVIADWREPNVIRMAPVPLYNSFEDMWRFGQKLDAALS